MALILICIIYCMSPEPLGALEVFHNALLKYAPKRQCFSNESMKQRTNLAILQHNENAVPKPKLDAEGQYQNYICEWEIVLYIIKTIIVHTILSQETLWSVKNGASVLRSGSQEDIFSHTPPTSESDWWSWCWKGGKILPSTSRTNLPICPPPTCQLTSQHFLNHP